MVVVVAIAEDWESVIVMVVTRVTVVTESDAVGVGVGEGMDDGEGFQPVYCPES